MFNHEIAAYDCPLCQIAKGTPVEMGSQEADVIYRDDLCTAFIAGKEMSPARRGS